MLINPEFDSPELARRAEGPHRMSSHVPELTYQMSAEWVAINKGGTYSTLVTKALESFFAQDPEEYARLLAAAVVGVETLFYQEHPGVHRIVTE